jgi:hypothetical protein
LKDVPWDKLVEKCKIDHTIKEQISFLVNKEALKMIQRTAA